VDGPDEVEQVRALGVVELQSSRDAVEHLVGGSRDLPPFQAVVVVDADAGQQGDLLAAKPRNAARPAVGRKAHLLGREPGAPRSQEVAGLALGVHATERTSGDRRPGGTGNAWTNRASRSRPHPCFLSSAEEERVLAAGLQPLTACDDRRDVRKLVRGRDS